MRNVMIKSSGIAALLCGFSVAGCQSKTSQGGANVARRAAIQQSNGDSTGSAPDKKDGLYDYPTRFCSLARTLKLKPEAKIEEELGYFCGGETPTKDMLELRASLVEAPDKLILKKVSGSHSAENETSEFTYVWGYYLPNLRPYKVKEAPLYTYIAKNFKDDVSNATAKTERLPDKSIDYGLHLWSAAMGYDLTINAAEGIVLLSKRKTQYNLYQVESGNEEMGFGVEHMTDGNNGDFFISNMLNLSMNDGKGFNDGVGGTVVLTMLHLKMSNRGFPETTEKVIEKLMYFFAKSMYDGLKSIRQ